LNDEQALALLAADTDRTQDYVFESARLPEIRGASRQLDDLNHRIKALTQTALAQSSDSRCRVIYAGGGSLLALVPAAVAPQLAREIEALYPRETTTATITADWRPVTAEMLAQGYPPRPGAPFGSLVQWAGTWLRRRKESHLHHPFVVAAPHTERCASCNRRPADPATLGQVQGLLCGVCRAKRQYAGRDTWFRQVELARTGVSAPDLTPYLPQTLGEIGQASRGRPGYVGFIYLDGDGLGRVLETLPTAEAYTAVSQAIESAARTAVFGALRDLRPTEVRREAGVSGAGGNARVYPFEILTIGGDDVMLIVPADLAIPVACAISRVFESEMQKQLATAPVPQAVKSAHYTLSGGVVLSDDHNPVRFLRDLAQELQDSAKAARKATGANEGYLDFLVLKSADMLEQDLEALRGRYPYTLERPGEVRPLRLLGRPYSAATLQALWEGLGQLRKAHFANSQMQQLAQALLSGQHEATLFYLYQHARDRESYAVLDGVLKAVQGGGPNDPPPWIQITAADRDYDFQTALWDISELYAFVREG